MKKTKEIKCPAGGFIFAINGIKRVLAERNMRFHLAMAAAVVAAGLLLRLSALEWTVVITAIGMVLAAESFNTAVEILSDRVCAHRDTSIGLVKDVAAGAVLIASCAAAIVGCIIIIPKIFLWVLGI